MRPHFRESDGWVRYYLPPIADRILIEDALCPKMTYRTEIVGCSEVPRSVVKCKCEDASAIVMEDGPYTSHERMEYGHGYMRARAYTRCVIYRWGVAEKRELRRNCGGWW